VIRGRRHDEWRAAPTSGGVRMSANDNIKTIQGVYEAFGRGDVAAIVDAVADDVDWAAEAAGTTAPWWGPKRGKDGVGAFFQAFGTTMQVEEFTPMSIAANDTDVMAVVQFRVKSLATDKHAAMHLHHYFKFRDGKIVYYRGTENTLQTHETLS
jgi:uncharacterized protein